MNPRWIPAGAAAAVALFFWSFVSHMVIGFEESYIKGLPNDAAVAAVLKDSIPEKGMYFYPNEKDMEKLPARLATMPTGIITYTPPGSVFHFGASLARQFGLYLVCALIAAWMYAKALPALHSLPEQIAFAALFGIAGVILMTGGYANWYGMPWGLVAVTIVEQAIGWTLVGVIFSKMIR